jgi:hypothetical protein
LLALAITAVPFTGLLTLASLHARANGDADDFQPIVEAEMPEGFPQHTPVGEVQVKRYPAYRKAQADVETGNAFWKLFTHIKKNDVAMTAPVEMTYYGDRAAKERAMSFLYGSSDLGAPGRQGSVEVVDVSPMIVVSTGVRGPRTKQAVDTARQRLEAWLTANGDDYEADGELRVMAYNSPFVPRDRNFFEVEIPIRPVR